MASPPLEPAVIGALELLGVPLHRQLERDHGALPAEASRQHAPRTRRTAGAAVGHASVRRLDPGVGFPAICKPAAEDASLGVEQRSVVRTGRALAERVEAMHERWDEVVVQRYIDGREVNVGIVGDQVLRSPRSTFGGMPRGMLAHRVISVEVGARQRGGQRRHAAVSRGPAVGAGVEIAGIAISAWRPVGGEGYGRVDFRIDARAVPWLLEVNANPDLRPTAGLARWPAPRRRVPGA